MMRLVVFQWVVLCSTAFVTPLPLPPLGWSTWNTFKCHINATLIESSIRALASSPLHRAGYNWVLIDDCWTTCAKFNPEDGSCKEPGLRDTQGRIVVDAKKFPSGFKPLTDLAHTLGLKIGIYTSVSAVTCGGYVGSLHNEAIDARTFAQWGFDLVKHDTCGTDYSVHDGGLQNATQRMRNALFEEGSGKIVYYLDSGNPTSPQKLFNPHQRHVTDLEALQKLAIRPEELAYVWTSQWDDGKGPHMVKFWFDRDDTWISVLSNAHAQIGTAPYQRSGHYNNPDMLTIGMGSQSEAEYRSQFFLWAVLGAPLIMGNDIRSQSDFTVALVTNPEILAVDQDKDCVQGSQVRDFDGTETWIKPLSDGSFAAVLFNKGNSEANGTVWMDGDWHNQQDFFPAKFASAKIRDLYNHKDLGTYSHVFSWKLAPHDAIIVKIEPVQSARPDTILT